MSASREKKARQERGADYLSPQQIKDREERQSAKRTTLIFALCAAAFVAFVVASALWNSGVIQRSAKAASVNGKTYAVSDMAYFYYNARATALNNSSNELDSGTSMREQQYTDGEQTWYDYLSGQALDSLATIVLTSDAAKAAGFTGGGDVLLAAQMIIGMKPGISTVSSIGLCDIPGFTGGEEVEKTVSDTMENLASSAASYGYSVSNYIKAIFGSMMTRSGFERMLRNSALAEAYLNSLSDPAAYTEEELQAQYDAEPNAFSQVQYEAVVFNSSSFSDSSEESEDSEAAEESADLEDATAQAKAAAEDALAHFRAGESLEAVAQELNGTYSNTSSLYGTGSDMLTWLFDDARRNGDSAVLDYTYYGTSMGSVVVVFHGKERDDFHAVDVRHILVDDEAQANELLAQYLAGEQTEDAFAALATEHSTDTGSAENGGLYTGVYPGQMVAAFNDWCFDASRQSGDTGIVATDYGYHVMYFVGSEDYPYWQEIAASRLASEKNAELTENVDKQLLDGMKYIDP